ncbi:hypothetical protein MLD38_012860 [Melastoma candidum]|uniref:Uncharacterized protein n=1 Tax=Melastoma candidum TaxID=119954 RepID=A0ACB9R7S2_9MYRT|nr:hypothetical protein MLD38_012860 [Melastoma candidum]
MCLLLTYNENAFRRSFFPPFDVIELVGSELPGGIGAWDLRGRRRNMGGVCSGGTAKVKKDPGGKSSGLSGKLTSNQSSGGSKEDVDLDRNGGRHRKAPSKHDSGELKKSPGSNRKATSKVTPKNLFIGRSGIVGLDKAVEVLDTLGSSVSNLNPGSSFLSGIASRGSRISILAFEVANTIMKGSNLMQSLSPENVHFLKTDIMHSQGVKLLVSRDVIELLILAAADKREELEVFSREVVRFGNLCKDPQWHNLERYFSRLDSEDSDHRPHRAEAEASMQELTNLARHTSELYHELQALDRFEQDYQQKADELESLNLPRKGEGIAMLHNEVKHQKKLVRGLKKKSLWSKNLEEIMEKLVDCVTYIHHAISEAFEDNGMTSLIKEAKRNTNGPQRLGTAGLALHYANVINQIDTIASRPSSLPSNTRDSLYNGLPPPVKKALHRNLQTANAKEELSVAEIKAEMEKTLQWLVPVATNTIKAHQGFGWVGEWANSGSMTEIDKSTPSTSNLIRLQTLYHADKQKMDNYILDLVTWLHHLISQVRNRDYQPYQQMLFQSPNPKRRGFSPGMSPVKGSPSISQEDRNLLERVCQRRMVPGISKSQEFPVVRRRKKNRVWAVSKSADTSPVQDLSSNVGLETPGINVLDVMDGLGLGIRRRVVGRG